VCVDQQLLEEMKLYAEVFEGCSVLDLIGGPEFPHPPSHSGGYLQPQACVKDPILRILTRTPVGSTSLIENTKTILQSARNTTSGVRLVRLGRLMPFHLENGY
jgi:hypothetical protein